VLSQHHLGACVAAEVPASIADQFLSLDAQPAEWFSQLRAIYDGAPVGLAFVNTRLRYVNLNQKLAEMNGQSVEAHLGRPVSEMVKPEVYAQVEPYLKRALNGESFPGIEVQKPSTAPGAPAATMMATHQPVRDEAGEILGVCVSITDISVVKQKEEAPRESEDNYRHMVELNPPITDSWVPRGTTSASVPVGRHSPALPRKRQRSMAGRGPCRSSRSFPQHSESFSP
jgi:PAS domain S-box-containing protein